jgi:hypothetical protein
MNLISAAELRYYSYRLTYFLLSKKYLINKIVS